MNAEITVRFKTNNLIDESELQEWYGGDFKQCVLHAIESEGLFGVVGNDYRIVNIKRGDD